MRRRNLIVGASVALVLVILVVALWPRPQRELSYVTSPASRGDIHHNSPWWDRWNAPAPQPWSSARRAWSPP